MATIMYLDDECDLTKIFELFFENSNHQVTTFNTEAEALEYCLKTPPDIIFIDYRLNQMTADEFIKPLDNPGKLILVTGDLHVGNPQYYHTVIKKPFKYKEVIDLINSLTE